mmetsp:Transcript_18985/g.31117  ORF Transcript_18985/g.31117 Transcript_18985/m.31117 type:complete len:171 (+) Transcript_18985:420-932(+)
MLESLLRGPSGDNPVQVEVAGVSGELATRTMGKRLHRFLAAAHQENKPYSWVLILGGTNDLCTGIGEGRILDSLYKMHDLAHEAGARTVAITVPEMSHESAEGELSDTRNAVNDGLRKYAQDNSSNTVLLDVATLMPLSDASLWDDGLHFSPSGYDKLGELVYYALRPHL